MIVNNINDVRKVIEEIQNYAGEKVTVTQSGSWSLINYRGVEIFKSNCIDDKNNPPSYEMKFMTKLGLRKRQYYYNIPKIDDLSTPVDSMVKSFVDFYAVSVYKSQYGLKGRPCYCTKAVLWNDEISTNEGCTIQEVLEEIFKYVDYELEPNRSKTYGWNLFYRMKQWHENQRHNMSDWRAIYYVDFKGLKNGFKGMSLNTPLKIELYNKHKALVSYIKHENKYDSYLFTIVSVKMDSKRNRQLFQHETPEMYIASVFDNRSTATEVKGYSKEYVMGIGKAYIRWIAQMEE